MSSHKGEKIDGHFEVSAASTREQEPLDNYPAPRLKPETYPGDYPSEWDGYIVTSNEVIRLRYSDDESLPSITPTFRPVIKADDKEAPLDDYLASYGLSPLEERFPIVTYGSNRNPGQLISKFTSKDLKDKPKLQFVPVFRATLHGVDVVYNAAPGNLGYFFAELYEGPETQDTEVEAAILLLTWDQLKALHATEKAYEFGDLTTLKPRLGATTDNPNQGIEVPGYVYSGPTSIYGISGNDGRPAPVAVAEVQATGRGLTAKGQIEMQQLFFANDPRGAKRQALIDVSGDTSIESSPNNFMKYMKMGRAGGVSTLKERKAFQEQLKKAMAADEQIAIDLRQNHGFDRLSERLPTLFTMAQIAIASPRGQGWWHKVPKE